MSKPGASGLLTEKGLPERITPFTSVSNDKGFKQGCISQYTLHALTLRAISCVYWEPKSITIIFSAMRAKLQSFDFTFLLPTGIFLKNKVLQSNHLSYIYQDAAGLLLFLWINLLLLGKRVQVQDPVLYFSLDEAKPRYTAFSKVQQPVLQYSQKVPAYPVLLLHGQ